MGRVLPALAVLLLLPTASAEFGGGPVGFREYAVPGAESAPEPTVGIPWDTDSVFFHAGSETFRARFDAVDEPSWEDVTAQYQSPTNLDPMLHADPDLGRVWAGGLAGPCSIMVWTDDDGETWVPTGNMCNGVRFDHQSIGSGPPAGENPANVAFAHNVYYCGQLGAIACTVSYDGGESFLPFQDATGSCGGFHGHIRVSRVTGQMAVPVPSCGGELGFIESTDNGLSYQSVSIPGTPQWTNGFDPSLQFTRDAGWMYYGMAWEHGLHIALSKDGGESWEALGAGHGLAETLLDVGQFHDPPVVAGTFSDVQAGDDDRVAFAFLGLEAQGAADTEFLRSNQIYQCDERQDELVWHYYVALSYDAGTTWDVQRISDDPVQVGGIYDSVIGGSGGCRNLLDFNDMDIDSMGRLHIAWADGCVRECAETGEPDTDGYRTRVGKVFRQVGGLGLFAEHDLPAPEGEGGVPGTEEDGRDEDTPAASMPLVAGIVAAAGLAARRRR